MNVQFIKLQDRHINVQNVTTMRRSKNTVSITYVNGRVDMFYFTSESEAELALHKVLGGVSHA